MTVTYQIFSSPLGEILVAGSGFAVTHVMRGDYKHQLSSDFRLEHDDASTMDKTGYIREACGVIASYLSGKTQRIDIAVQVGGTEFERKVWHELRQIPYGKTASYSDIAQAIGSPDAFRAVANACASNPVPLIIPCHRAVHKAGDAVGFAWGPEAKHYLLELEKQHTAALSESAV